MKNKNKMSEFKLSDKRETNGVDDEGWYWEGNVKEATQNLKKEERRILQEIFNEWEIDDYVVDWVFNELDKAFEKHIGDLK